MPKKSAVKKTRTSKSSRAKKIVLENESIIVVATSPSSDQLIGSEPPPQITENIVDDDPLGVGITSTSIPIAELPPIDPNLVSEETLEAVVDKIASLNLPPPAKIEAANLVEVWIRENAAFDSQFPTVAVEIPFFLFVDKFTIVVGLIDRIALDNSGLFGCEWKTTKGTTKFWNEDKWLESISNGHQIGTYALAMKKAQFLIPSSSGAEITDWYLKCAPDGQVSANAEDPSVPPIWTWAPKIKSPRMMVRAITKESPSQIWPSQNGHAIFDFDRDKLTTVENAYFVKGEVIRAARLSGKIPWELPGMQCFSRYNRELCQCSEPFCAKGEHPVADPATAEFYFARNDPGSKAIRAAGSLLRCPLNDPRVVILSASSYDSARDCLELYRIQGLNLGKEENGALDIGSAFHEGVAEFYRRMG